MGEIVKDTSYRVRLASEMRKSIRPMMKSWGFDHPPKGSPDWFMSSRLNTWVRQRDGYTDEIAFTWDKYGGARYAIDMMTSQVERMVRPEQGAPFGTCLSISLLDRRLYLFRGLIDLRFEYNSGRRFLRDEIAHAIQRLKAAEHYLQTGEASRHILVGGCVGTPGSPVEPVFWWREGETGAANLRIAQEQRERAAATRQRRRAEGSRQEGEDS